ncbi:E domain-containing protein, partial [Staphylococcus pseudintermedius]|nr:E domain-containing protein [Staphylococcus pseudintermedius]
PITVNPITGEKVGEGKPTEEITKDPVPEITEFGGKEEVPGHPGIINPETGKEVMPPQDDITKYGPKTGTPEKRTEEIPEDLVSKVGGTDPDSDAGLDSNKKELPDTGNNSNNNGGALFGTLFAAVGSLLLFRNRKKNNEEK